MIEKLTTRGGAKKGAGRPKGSVKGRGIVKPLTFKPELWEKIEEEARKRFLKPTDFVYLVLSEALRKTE